MPVIRLQFRLSTLLWITLAVACFFGGREYHRRWETAPPFSTVDHWVIRDIPLDGAASGDFDLDVFAPAFDAPQSTIDEAPQKMATDERG
jgi:hypothetical protein